MALSTAAKAGIGGSLASVGGVAGTAYFGQDYINYYEVEREIMNKDVIFKVEEVPGDQSQNITGWKIKISDDNSGWNESKDGEYYWECIVSKKDGINLDKTDLEVKLNAVFGWNTQSIRKHLINVCSKDRKKKETKKVKSTFTFPELVTDQNWSEYLFGEKDPLNETEKEVLKDNVYLNVPASSSTTASVTAQATVASGTWGYSWQCTVNSSNGNLTSFNTKFPSSESEVTSTSYKKANKKRLVYACSRSRTTDEPKKVVATFSSTADVINKEFPNT